MEAVSEKRGKLVVLMGIDGSGKSTVAMMLKKLCIDNTLVTSCVHDARYRAELRELEKRFNFRRRELLTFEFKQLLYIGSAVQSMMNDIDPYREKGINVILDRYVMCIQVVTNVFAEKSFHCMIQMMDCLPKPDLGLYLDVDVCVAANRIEKRCKEATKEINSRYENIDSLTKKKREYERLIRKADYPILRIDANQEVESVVEDIREVMKSIGIG